MRRLRLLLAATALVFFVIVVMMVTTAAATTFFVIVVMVVMTFTSATTFAFFVIVVMMVTAAAATAFFVIVMMVVTAATAAALFVIMVMMVTAAAATAFFVIVVMVVTAATAAALFVIMVMMVTAAAATAFTVVVMMVMMMTAATTAAAARGTIDDADRIESFFDLGDFETDHREHLRDVFLRDDGKAPFGLRNAHAAVDQGARRLTHEVEVARDVKNLFYGRTNRPEFALFVHEHVVDFERTAFRHAEGDDIAVHLHFLRPFGAFGEGERKHMGAVENRLGRSGFRRKQFRKSRHGDEIPDRGF